MDKNIQLPISNKNKLKHQNVEQWLNSKVNDTSISSQYEINEYTIRPYASHYDKITYYIENDSDLNANEMILYQLIDNMTDKELSGDTKINKLSVYMDHILLRPNTNRYHANSLFRQLIDFSYDNNYNYNIYNVNAREYINVNLMDLSLKESFYKFCHDNS